MRSLEFIIPVGIALLALWYFRHRIFDFLHVFGEMRAGTRVAPAVEAARVKATRAPSPDMLPLEEALAAVASMDPQRRRMLKMFGFGAGIFAIGKVLGPSFSLFPGVLDNGTTYFRNFRLVERGKELAFYDRLGNEILVLESDV